MNLQIAEPLKDSRNLELLRLLRGDPCMSVSEMARRVGMSAPAVRERIERLTEAGIIKGTRIEIDPRALGYTLSVFVRIRPMPGKLPKIPELAARLPQVVECHRITGEDCFILRVYLDLLDNLDVILDQFLVYGQTTTSIVQSTPLPLRHLPLPDEVSADAGAGNHEHPATSKAP
ncbi:MAG TPA: Lrp/AsnC family transcriptional regulator [Gammaproteobacteria bacterium]|jgi:Lrp/AsnC family leucine-responsive transcriptional regulator|nr:Lrp/AsnC family transcriptional regulator [Gammaproteobacteria bacterium]